jgi:hypothetical protein
VVAAACGSDRPAVVSVAGQASVAVTNEQLVQQLRWLREHTQYDADHVW